MSVRSILKSAFLAAAVLSTSARAADNIGAWDPVEIGQNETQLLTKALSTNDFYDESVTTRLCFLEIHSIVSQVVSGVKYKYSVEGCKTAAGVASTGECADGSANCVPTDYTVIVFEQPWTGMIKVLAIDTEEAAPAGSMATSNETAPTESTNTTTTNTTATTPTPTTMNTTKAPASISAPTTTPAPSSGAASLPGAALLIMTSVATYAAL